VRLTIAPPPALCIDRLLRSKVTADKYVRIGCGYALARARSSETWASSTSICAAQTCALVAVCHLAPRLDLRHLQKSKRTLRPLKVCVRPPHELHELHSGRVRER